ncbi:hypothetical protein KM043_008646 [Ampulex compressa]|nr:hypothetical protein KM043_008646 [Ampulex compressa]
MCRAGVISGIDISVTCEEIVKVLQTTSNRPYKRFSLYLSSQLMYGTVKIFWYQTIIFQNYLFEIKQKLERHVEAQRYIEGSEIREPPDILNVVQNYHDAHLDDNLHILEDESQADRLQAIRNVIPCTC